MDLFYGKPHPSGASMLVKGLVATPGIPVKLWLDGTRIYPPAPTDACKHRRLCIVYLPVEPRDAVDGYARAHAYCVACGDCDAEGPQIVMPGKVTPKWL